MSEKLYIVMPAYNEEANIKNVIEEWYPILDKADEESRLVVADGGSSDKTLEILYELQKRFSKLVVLSKPNTDHGTKVMILYKYAADNGADWIFQTDSDGQTIPNEFNDFWEMRGRFDVILGDRRKRGDGIVRKLVENVLRLYIKVFFGVMVPDANAPFRLMRCKLVEKYYALMMENFNLPNAVFSACFVKFKEKVAFKEITFRPRQGGKNSMNLKLIFKIGFQAIGAFAYIRKRIKEFGVAGENEHNTIKTGV